MHGFCICFELLDNTVGILWIVSVTQASMSVESKIVIAALVELIV